MSGSEITTIILALAGSGGLWAHLQLSAENKVLASQATKTMAAKDAEIEELRSENSTLWGKNQRLNEREDQLLHLLAACEARNPEVSP